MDASRAQHDADDEAGCGAGDGMFSESEVPTGPGVIHLHDATGRFSADGLAWLRDQAAKVGAHMALRGEVRVRIVNDDEMAAAHLEYCEIEGTTDVLTFDLIDGMAAEGEPLDTDILVCLDESARQAMPRGHRPEHEMLLYVLHGVLHCLGYDDHEDADFERMHAREDEVLRAIGVGAIFATTAKLDHGGAARGGGV